MAAEPQVANTVGELIAFLATLPLDMPLHRRGNIGDWPKGIVVQVRSLAKHKNPEENYYGDMIDPVWKKSRHTYGEEFPAAVIGR